MRALSAALTLAQRQMVIDPLWKIVLTHNSTTYTYGIERIKRIEHTEEERQQALVILDNSDKALTDLDLRGYKGVLSFGCVDEGNNEGYSPTAPLWVIAQQLYSFRGGLICGLSLGGLLDLLGADIAQSSYTPSSGDTRTVKDWLIEILNLTDTGSESTEEQTTADSDMPIYDGLRYYAGQRLTISDKTVTKLAFKLRKVGSPTGNIAFSIYTVDADDPLEGGELLATKVWGDANSLGTDYAWKEVTFDTPVQIDQEVRIICDFQGGNASNYVDLAYNASSVKADEWLTWIYLLSWTDEATYDAAYKYYYSSTPVTSYSHCTPIGIVFDSEDSLIDTFQPQDSLRISIGNNRLSIVKKLMGWTGCVLRAESDGKLHIFVPTTSGTDYDYEYELSEADDITGKHTFFNKNYRKRIVIPNYVPVRSREGDEPQYSGYAQDTESYALIPKKDTPLELRLSSDAQATSIAEAKLEKYKMNSGSGSGIVPMNVGAEVYDYENLIDAREGNNKVGNIKWLKRVCDAESKTFELTFRFGSLAEVPTTIGLPPTLTADLKPPSAEPDFLVLVENMQLLQDNINILWNNYNAVNENLKSIAAYLESQRNDALFRILAVTEQLTIPSEAA